MSTTGATADPPPSSRTGSGRADPLAALGSLPGVAESVESVRKAVDRVYGHRIMRRRSPEITSEAALRGARGSAALSGADWAACTAGWRGHSVCGWSGGPEGGWAGPDDVRHLTHVRRETARAAVRTERAPTGPVSQQPL